MHVRVVCVRVFACVCACVYVCIIIKMFIAKKKSLTYFVNIHPVI